MPSLLAKDAFYGGSHTRQQPENATPAAGKEAAAAAMEYDDLATLSSIDPGVVMQTLKDRHAGDKIYTKNGAVLVAINPYKSIEVYGDAELKQYKESMALETEPPVFFVRFGHEVDRCMDRLERAPSPMSSKRVHDPDSRIARSVARFADQFLRVFSSIRNRMR